MTRLALLVIALSAAARADEAALKLSGFVDVDYAANLSRPADRDNFVPGAGTTAKRSGEFALNLAALTVAVEPKPVGLHFTLNAGSGSDVLHAAEPAFRFIYDAYATFALPGVTLDAGVFPCHVGFEGFFSKDNWNYTRSWMGEFSPYYSAGLRATVPLSPRWSVQLHLINGWQSIGDVNRAKTVGTQVAYSGEVVTASFNTLAGPELAGDDSDWRLLGDLVVVVKARAWLQFGGSVDVGRQALRGGGAAVWHAAAAYLRLLPAETVAVSARAEYFADPDAGISGAAQTLGEGTLTAEWRPAPALLLKLEGRSDHSTRRVFAGGAHAQPLAVASAVATF